MLWSNPRHLPPALALLQHPTIKLGYLLRYHLGSLAPCIRDSPNHSSHPKEEITFILLSLLVISFQVCGPSGAWMLSGCRWKEMGQVPSAANQPREHFYSSPLPKCPVVLDLFSLISPVSKDCKLTVSLDRAGVCKRTRLFF